MRALGNANTRREAGQFHRKASAGLGWLAGIAALPLLAGLSLPKTSAADVPVMKGDLGPCSAEFTVTDATHKPLYDAKISVTIRYGFMNRRRTDLEVGTNGDGKARIEGLPDKVKKPLEFQVRHGQHAKSLAHDPATECHTNIVVVLGTQ
jgi:hypothetical protein